MSFYCLDYLEFSYIKCCQFSIIYYDWEFSKSTYLAEQKKIKQISALVLSHFSVVVQENNPALHLCSVCEY